VIGKAAKIIINFNLVKSNQVLGFDGIKNKDNPRRNSSSREDQQPTDQPNALMGLEHTSGK